MLTALIAGVILAGFIVLPEMVPDGNGLVTYANYLKMNKQRQEQRQMSVDEVEAILGPAGRVTVYPSRDVTQQTRLYIGQRDRRGRRPLVTVQFYNGQILYDRYKTEYEPTLLTRILDELETWFRRWWR